MSPSEQRPQTPLDKLRYEIDQLPVRTTAEHSEELLLRLRLLEVEALTSISKSLERLSPRVRGGW